MTDQDHVGAKTELPLAGIRVVESGSYLSVPFAAQMLANLGADVIKVEPIRGDPFRRYNLRHRATSAVWINANAGKRSVALDLKTQAGRRDMKALLGEADVFLENWRPGVALTLGIDRDELVRQNPRLVYVGVRGFGESGPHHTIPVFDGLLQAASGIAAYEGGRYREPRVARSFLADKTTAAFAVQAVLAALLRRERNGRGGVIDLSMLDVMAYFNFPDVGQDHTFLDPISEPIFDVDCTGVLETSDGYILVAPVTGRQVSAAVSAVGHPEWKEALKKTCSAVELVNILYARLSTVMRDKTTREWEAIFREHDVPAFAVLSVDEHLDDPQTIHNALYGTASSPEGTVRRVRYPALIDGSPLPSLAAAPERPTTGVDQLNPRWTMVDGRPIQRAHE